MSRFAIFSAFALPLFGAIAVAQSEPKVAATVNGQAIPQIALDRALERFDEAERAKARGEILDFLIDNVLIDQYLLQQKIEVKQEDITARLAEIKKEIEKNGQTYAKVLASLKMAEDEFLVQVTNDLRWEKYAANQASDTNLKAMFEQHPDMFDGSMARARHILLTDAADAKSKLAEFRKQVEAKATEAVAKLPADADAKTRDEERQKQLEAAFGELAKEKSTCPSKRDGGDLNWFPRAGHMVEPFAKAAFALKPFEMSEPVHSQFGWHLILLTGRKAGTPVKFEDVKDEVKDVYCSRLREAIAGHLKQSAKIVVTPVK